MKRIHFFFLLIVALVVSITLEQIDFNDKYSKPINSDGKGYYAYLPAIFIYNDYNYSFIAENDAKYYPEDGTHNKDFLAKQSNGRSVNKYFPGVALFYLPFFALAALLSALFGLPVDGYNMLFQWAVAIAHWFYLFWALLVLYDTYLQLKFKKWSIWIGLIAVVLATNLLYYVAYDFTVTHLFGFFGCSVLIWSLVKYRNLQSYRYIGIFIGMLGILLIVRPTNVMMLCVLPLLLDWHMITELIKPKTWFKKQRWMYLFIGAFIVFLAPLLWKIQSGKWIVYSYGEEGFNFSKPELFKFLFSYEKGWFLWSPIVLIMLIFAAIYYYRQEKTKGLLFILSFFGIVYVFSSWWIWTFGVAYGQRPMIDFYPILLLGFIGLVDRIKTKYYLLLLLPLLPLNFIQTFQFHEGILNERTVDGKAYWGHFLQLKKDPERVKLSDSWKKMRFETTLKAETIDAKKPFSSAVELDSVSENAKLVVNCQLSGEYKKTDTELVLSDSTGAFYQVHYLKGSIYESPRTLQFSFDINQKLETPLKCYLMNVNKKYPLFIKKFEVAVYQKNKSNLKKEQ